MASDKEFALNGLSGAEQARPGELSVGIVEDDYRATVAPVTPAAQR